ncbi:MAG: hypothetical protein QOH56_3616 [Pseudonocardiales bacterium]|nr:hypothetical protein [Frankiales bacterium]MDQ1737365.1 hypothetical protein [Pseudonocardiales bacterium]
MISLFQGLRGAMIGRVADELGIPFQYRFDVTPTTADGMAGALFWHQHSRPRLLGVYGGIAVAVVFLGVLVQSAFVPIATVLIALPLVSWTIHRRLRRECAAIATTGGTFETGFGPTSLVIKTPLSESTMDYTDFDSVDVRRGFVILKHRGTRVYSVLPIGLFPAEDLDRIRIGSTASRK